VTNPLRALVLVGTDVHPFTRLMDWIVRLDAMAPGRVEWTIQYGSSPAPDLPGAAPFLDRATVEAALARADIVICHGGPATIAESRRARHRPLVVPRDPARNEHIDDHQQRFARRLARDGLVVLCETGTALVNAFAVALADPAYYRLEVAELAQAVEVSAQRVGDIADALAARVHGVPTTRLRRHNLRASAAGIVLSGGVTATSSDAPASARPPAQRRPVDEHLPAERRSAPAGRPESGPRHAAADDDRPVRVLYIGGWGRSGSTLLERLVAEMPEFAGAGEITHLWHRGLIDGERCGCGTPFHECPFWSKVGWTAFGGWHEVDADDVLALRHAVDRTRFVPRLALPTRLTRDRRQLGRYGELHRHLYSVIAAVAAADIVVDSSKHASLAFTLRHDPGIDLRVIHLVRDPRGVAYSWAKTIRRPEATDDGATMPRYSFLKSALWWTLNNAMFHVLRLVQPGRVLLMRYEDVVADPAAALARIRTFVGLPSAEPAFLRTAGGTHLVDFETIHSVAGNPMRFATGSVALQGDDAWRTGLPPGARRLISLLTAPLRWRYRYIGRRRAAS
jgi:UDP-N-acetylglucosamine transferase subunit ALG13